MFKIWLWSGPYDYLGYFLKKDGHKHMCFRYKEEAIIFAKENVKGNFSIVEWDVK